MERRAFEIKELRVERAEGKPAKLGGYAAVFNSNSVVLDEGAGPFVERIQPGAFGASLGGDVRALFNHDPNFILGRSTAGTLRLVEDERGLAFELDLPETTLGRDLAVSVERGDIREMSFAFRVPKGGDAWAKVGNDWLRTLKQVTLVDVSPVTFAAYPATEVGLRSVAVDAETRAALKKVQAEEQSAVQQLADERAARERKLQLRERALPREQRASPRAADLERFREQWKAEKREAPYEDKIDAVWCALYALLGSPWPAEGPGWHIEATYPDRVIVERLPGQYYSYPLTFDVENVPQLGAPTSVEAQYVPVAAPAA
jgi:HK97 family phage prohead protease